ncbi:AAA family ATPase [Streptomyces sp. MUM 178J]|uniref:AAA family ATPase n=1 Tax=Streptomyces sp. MUM 178J TaxID=2791991 RepID=UPI001F0444BE|nr:AAA family ATPase [Streptomyces sp. MUM 178J]WRQ80294.1 AAA family ATPase [Streptomyces sp. MUM 178J]
MIGTEAARFCVHPVEGRACDMLAASHGRNMLGHPFTPPAEDALDAPDWMPDRPGPVDRDDAQPDTSGNPTQDRLAQLRAALVGSAGLDAIPDPVPLIDGVLFRDSLAWLYGKPGSGKSFLALDWAGCVAAGMPWQLRETARGRVLYLVAEGVSGIRKRVRAWESAFRQTMDDVTFLPVAVQFINGVDRAALLALVAEVRPLLVIVDTQARVTVGMDENSNGEMGRVVAVADAIRQAAGACVLMVHHSGKNGLDMRGASAIEGAATSVIKVSKDGGRWVDVTCEKQKDVEPFGSIRLRMTPAADSVVLSATTADDVAATTEAQNKILEALRQSFGSVGASVSQLIKVTEIPERTLYREVKALVDRGSIARIGTPHRSRYFLAGMEPTP